MTEEKKHRSYGWRPNGLEPKDLKLEAKFPEKVDLRLGFPIPVYDQGDLGSSTACATSSILAYHMARAHDPAIEFKTSSFFSDDRGCLIWGDDKRAKPIMPPATPDAIRNVSIIEDKENGRDA